LVLLRGGGGSKRIRTGSKVRAEYGAVKDLPLEQGRGGQGKAAAAPLSSTALALPGNLRLFVSHSHLLNPRIHCPPIHHLPTFRKLL
jgi:hypothetical protein